MEQCLNVLCIGLFSSILALIIFLLLVRTPRQSGRPHRELNGRYWGKDQRPAPSPAVPTFKLPDLCKKHDSLSDPSPRVAGFSRARDLNLIAATDIPFDPRQSDARSGARSGTPSDARSAARSGACLAALRVEGPGPVVMSA